MFYQAFRRFCKAFCNDFIVFVQGFYKAFTKHLQGDCEDIKMFYFFLYTVLTRLLRSWFLTFYKKFRFVFGRCFTRLLYGSYVFYIFYKDLNRLLQGFYKAFTQLSQGVYKTLQVFCTRFPHICLQCFLQGFDNVLYKAFTMFWQGFYRVFSMIFRGLYKARNCFP